MTDTTFAEKIDATLDYIGDLTPEQADVFEWGATTILGITDHSIEEMRSLALTGARVQGVSDEEANLIFNIVFDGLTNVMLPHVRRIKEAVRDKQGFPADAEAFVASLIAALTEASGTDAGVEVIDLDLTEGDEATEAMLAAIFGAGAR